MNRTPHVIVLGGGIGGLAAALHLRGRAAAGALTVRVTIVEKSGRLGGCVETRRNDGFLMEMGAESLPVEKPWAIALVERIGLGEALLEPRAETKGTLLLRGRRLRRLPSDFALFTPRSLVSLATSGLFSPVGVARAAMEPFVPPRRNGGDESLAAFVTRRFGREVLDRLAQPLLGGIYSADPRNLSMEAALPGMLRMERERGSLVRAMRATEPATGARLVTLRGGLGSMVERVSAELSGVDILQDEALSATPRSSHDGIAWSVALARGGALHADAIICALPAHDAATVLGATDDKLAVLLRGIRYNSLAVVTLAYRDGDFGSLPRAHGILVPYLERKHVTALTFSSLKFQERAPAGGLLLRAYVGGALQREFLERDDGDLVAIVRADLREILGTEAAPLFSVVRRWEKALPEYGIGHLERVAGIESRTAALPQIALAGAAYRGVGVSDCIRSGESAGEAVAAKIVAPALNAC
jgi:oxygen-dependent protoporphyrinogen oxidase